MPPIWYQILVIFAYSFFRCGFNQLSLFKEITNTVQYVLSKTRTTLFSSFSLSSFSLSPGRIHFPLMFSYQLREVELTEAVSKVDIFYSGAYGQRAMAHTHQADSLIFELSRCSGVKDAQSYPLLHHQCWPWIDWPVCSVWNIAFPKPYAVPPCQVRNPDLEEQDFCDGPHAASWEKKYAERYYESLAC